MFFRKNSNRRYPFPDYRIDDQGWFFLYNSMKDKVYYHAIQRIPIQRIRPFKISKTVNIENNILNCINNQLKYDLKKERKARMDFFNRHAVLLMVAAFAVLLFVMAT